MRSMTMDTPPSKKLIAYEGIKQMIIDGNFEKDTLLVERQLCEVLEVSRTPVREALRELASDGLVEVVDGKGVYVKKIDFKDLVEIYELREALECMAIKLYIERAGDEGVKKLKALMLEQNDAYQKEEHARFMKLDMKIHNLIADGAQNSRIKTSISNIYDQIHQMALAAKDEEKIRDIAFEAHMRITEAVEERDVEKAQEAMRNHIKKVKGFYKERFYLL